MVKILIVLQLLFSLGTAALAAEFQTKKIKLGSQTLSVEIADTDQKRGKGLMYRKDLPDGKGMLFVFQRPQVLSFWMKNTFVPLSIGFFDEKRRLLEVQDMKPADSVLDSHPPVYSSRESALYALEVPRGWFSKHNVKVGTQFTFVD